MLLDKIADSTQLCSTHFTLLEDVSVSSIEKILETSCFKCSIGWRITFKAQQIPSLTLSKLLKSNDALVNSSVIFMLSYYTANIYHGDRKSINSENARFQQFIGINSTSMEIMEMIGYRLEGKQFEPVPGGSVNDLESILEELSLQQLNLSNGKAGSNPTIFSFGEATFILAQTFGCAFNDISNSKLFLDSMKRVINFTQSYYVTVGCLNTASDNLVIQSCDLLRTKFPSKSLLYLDAVVEIAKGRQSGQLEEFVLMERSKVSYYSRMDVDSVELPAGLYNIGNTCYLNSLLQFYFSVTDLREYVMQYETRNLDIRAELLLSHLKKLFLDLMRSDRTAVTPDKVLAQIILNDTTGILFGEQQDIHETMDNVIDLLQTLLTGKDKELLLGLFFGKTKQTVRYTDRNGEAQVLNKEEDFHQLIVDVLPCLGRTLDQYFAPQEVEFEYSQASRSVSVINFPPILSIRLNVNLN